MAKKLPRREFLQTLGGAAVVSALPLTVEAQAKRPVGVFFEHGFPRIQNLDITAESFSNFTFLTEAELIARLNARDFDLFINPYGSAFPKRAWTSSLLFSTRSAGDDRHQ